MKFILSESNHETNESDELLESNIFDKIKQKVGSKKDDEANKKLQNSRDIRFDMNHDEEEEVDNYYAGQKIGKDTVTKTSKKTMMSKSGVEGLINAIKSALNNTCFKNAERFQDSKDLGTIKKMAQQATNILSSVAEKIKIYPDICHWEKACDKYPKRYFKYITMCGKALRACAAALKNFTGEDNDEFTEYCVKTIEPSWPTDEALEKAFSISLGESWREELSYKNSQKRRFRKGHLILIDELGDQRDYGEFTGTYDDDNWEALCEVKRRRLLNRFPEAQGAYVEDRTDWGGSWRMDPDFGYDCDDCGLFEDSVLPYFQDTYGNRGITEEEAANVLIDEFEYQNEQEIDNVIDMLRDKGIRIS